MRYGYARVSTDSGEQLDALMHQRLRLENAGVDRVVEDVESGLRSDRPGYQEVLEAIQTGACTHLLVTRLDRIGRDAVEVDSLLAFAAKRGCVVEALDGGRLESETPQGFLLTRVMSSLAEMESRMLSQRIKAGLESRRRAGAPIRARAPWGYRVNETRTALEPDPEQWPRAQAMLKLLEAEGWRFRAALRRWRERGLGPVPLSDGNSLRSWALNPILRGGTGYHRQPRRQFREIQWGTHTPLISEEEFTSLRLTTEANSRKWGVQVKLPYKLLTGLCRCAECGHRMAYQGGRRYPGLVCRGEGCSTRWKTTLESAIVSAVNAHLSAHANEVLRSVGAEHPDLAALRAEIAQLEAFHDPDLADAIARKHQKMRELHKAQPIDPELLKSLLQPEFWEVYAPEELRELYLGLVREVQVRYPGVERVLLRF